jgi:hypothetical protein
MGTQATLAIVQKGKVLLKVVCGCNGSNILALAKSLKRHPTTDSKKILERCLYHEVGCNSLTNGCLVIQCSPIEFLVPEGMDFELGPELDRWKRTFNDPKFNPRWDNGTASYSIVVDIDLCQKRPQQKSK